MNAQPFACPTLRELAGPGGGPRIALPAAAAPDLSGFMADDLEALAGRTVLVASRSQAASADALIALDGVAARLVICPFDLSPDQRAAIAEEAGVEAIVSDRSDDQPAGGLPFFLRSGLSAVGGPALPRCRTEWIMPTSGTTGRPKLVAHTLAGLIGAIAPTAGQPQSPPVWATFYDIRRYGGLQIFLRACLAGADLVLTDQSEDLGAFMRRCGAAGVTHLTGTPSHWRQLLMSPYAGLIKPAYVRLSGEIADQAILDALRRTWPEAAVIHAYASTEAGVAFEVRDGREGFPADYIDSLGGLPGVDIKLEAGTMRIRSARTALGYVGAHAPQLLDVERFVDTDDVVERIGDRCHFRGRRSGVINVGGNKVHPEEVEGIINLHPAVSMSRVQARRSPVLGDLIVADIVLKPAFAAAGSDEQAALQAEILATCRTRLDRHKIPVSLKILTALPLIGSGKMGRQNA